MFGEHFSTIDWFREKDETHVYVSYLEEQSIRRSSLNDESM